MRDWLGHSFVVAVWRVLWETGPGSPGPGRSCPGVWLITGLSGMEGWFGHNDSQRLLAKDGVTGI